MNRLRWLVLSTLGGAAALHFLLPAGRRAEVRRQLATIPATLDGAVRAVPGRQSQRRRGYTAFSGRCP